MLSNSKIETPSFNRQVSHKNFNVANKLKLGSNDKNNNNKNNNINNNSEILKIAGRYKSPSPILSKVNSKYLDIHKKNNPNNTYQTPKRSDIKL